MTGKLSDSSSCFSCVLHQSDNIWTKL